MALSPTFAEWVGKRTTKDAALIAAVGLSLFSTPEEAAAQSSSEMYSGSGSTAASAPTQGPVSVNLRANPDNPSANTSVAIAAPAPAVTIRVLNQQFATSTNFTTNGLMIGGTFVGDPHFTVMNFFGGAQNSHFTSLPSVAPGTGISASINHAFLLEARTGGLSAAATPATGRFYFADVEMVFSRPISNTVVHIAGLGGSAGGKEFSVELDFVQANSTGATGVSLLSGNGLLALSGNQINNAYNEELDRIALNPMDRRIPRATLPSMTHRGDGLLPFLKNLLEGPRLDRPA